MGSEQGYKKWRDIVPDGELECIWMKAGLVTYKLCEYNYECEQCIFYHAIKEHGEATPSQIKVGGYKLCNTLFYHPLHTWGRLEEGGRMRIGMDDLGQSILGQIQEVSLPKIGEKIKEGSIHVKGRCVNIPLSPPAEGYIIEVNKRLRQYSGMINSDPYGKGWFVIIRPIHLLKSLKQLYYGYRAEEWYRREVARLYISIKKVAGVGLSEVGITMQDGGRPVIDILDMMGAREIEDIFKQFFTKEV